MIDMNRTGALKLLNSSCLLIVFKTLFFAGWLFAGWLLPSINVEAQNIKIVTEYLAPYQQRNADGSLGGYSTQVVRALVAGVGDTADILVLPWARAYAIALKEPNVLIYSISHSRERDALFHWVGILHHERAFIWGLKSRFSQPLSSLEEITPYIISTTHDSNPDIYLSRRQFKKLHHVVNAEQNIELLFKQRVDLIVGSALPVRTLVKQQGFDFAQIRPLFEIDDLNTDLSLAFSRDTDAKLVTRYQQAFAKMKQTGKLAAIRQKWRLEK